MQNTYMVTYSDELNHDSLQTVRSPLDSDKKRRKAVTSGKNVGSVGKRYGNITRGNVVGESTATTSKRFAPIADAGRKSTEVALDNAVKIAKKEMESANVLYASKKAEYESYKKKRMEWENRENKALQNANEAYDAYTDKKGAYDAALRDLQKLKNSGKA